LRRGKFGRKRVNGACSRGMMLFAPSLQGGKANQSRKEQGKSGPASSGGTKKSAACHKEKRKKKGKKNLYEIKGDRRASWKKKRSSGRKGTPASRSRDLRKTSLRKKPRGKDTRPPTFGRKEREKSGGGVKEGIREKKGCCCLVRRQSSQAVPSGKEGKPGGGKRNTFRPHTK